MRARPDAGSSSSTPRRTPTAPCGLRENIEEPHSPQKNFSAPSGGFHERIRSSPRRIRKAPSATRALGEAPAPVRRWQRVQWQ